MIIIVLVVLGLCFGSFVNALVYRLRHQESDNTGSYSILKGRSICPNCGHKLAAKDLVPIFSWLNLGGKCRYCSKPISWQYPAVEASTAALFTVSYVFWPYSLTSAENELAFAIWLVFLVGLVALILYDVKYMVLPNKIIFPLGGLAIAGISAEALLLGSAAQLKTALIGLLIGGGLFYVLFQISRGNWIGGGDVKLGFLLGAIIGGPWPALLMLFVASLLGTIYSLPLILAGRVRAKSRIPFGPFLIIAAVIVQLFGHGVISWYSSRFVL